MQATAYEGTIPGEEKRPIFHTAFATRHPAAFLNPTFTSRVPVGPLFCMVQSTDRTEGAVYLPASKLVDAIEHLGGDKLIGARQEQGGRPSVCITDNDSSLQNGLCRAFHGFRFVLLLVCLVCFLFTRGLMRCLFNVMQIPPLLRDASQETCRVLLGSLQRWLAINEVYPGVHMRGHNVHVYLLQDLQQPLLPCRRQPWQIWRAL